MTIVCELFGEDSCIGHDCIDRQGTPCFFDRRGVAGTEDALPDGVDDYFETHDVDDYKEFEDNEAWLDMRGEFDDDMYDYPDDYDE